jgi:hypothetical protein
MKQFEVLPVVLASLLSDTSLIMDPLFFLHGNSLQRIGINAFEPGLDGHSFFTQTEKNIVKRALFDHRQIKCKEVALLSEQVSGSGYYGSFNSANISPASLISLTV